MEVIAAIIGGIYGAIAILMFLYLYATGKHIFTRKGAKLFIAIICLFWPVSLILYFIDTLRGRVV